MRDIFLAALSGWTGSDHQYALDFGFVNFQSGETSPCLGGVNNSSPSVERDISTLEWQTAWEFEIEKTD